jgi:hypothetical protein
MCGRDDVRIRLARTGFVRRRGGVEPVTILESAAPQVILPRQRCDPVDPTAHAVELSRKDTGVPEKPVEHPWQNGSRVTPCRGGRGFGVQHVGMTNGTHPSGC